jgi:NAD(P)-dependent dehydrogenase (short-subunit alcohol dehydrogenase family)
MSPAVEQGRYGIRLNAIAAGPIPTDYAWEMLNPTSKSSVGARQADQVPLIAMDGGQHLAGPGTFAGLSSLEDSDGNEIRAQSQAASEAAKAQRTTTSSER